MCILGGGGGGGRSGLIREVPMYLRIQYHTL